MGWRGLIAGGAGLLVIAAAVMSEVVVRPAPVEGRIVVTYWEKWTNFEADAMRAVVDDFNRSQDRIFVKYLSVSGIREKTILSIAAKNPPDLAGVDATSVPQYAFNRAAMPLDDVIGEAGIRPEAYIPVFWEMCRYRGRLWALPTTPATTALHLNRKLLRESGWNPDQPPRTIEELDEMDRTVNRLSAGKLTRSGFLPSEPDWWPWCWPYFFGGGLWDGDGKITTDRPENVRAYTWVASYAKRYGIDNIQGFKQGFGSFDSPQNSFIDGKVASVHQGVWMANFITKYAPDFEWMAAPFPHPADRPDLANSAIVDLDVIIIPRGARHPKEAMEFLSYLQSQPAMEKLCLGQKKDSPLLATSPEFYAQHANPYIRLFRELSLGPNTFSVPKTPLWPEYSANLQQAVDQMNSGAKTPAQALADVRVRMQPRLDQIRRVEELREARGE